MISRRSGEPLDYVIKKGTKVISKGSTKQRFSIRSDGKSLYQLILNNPSNKAVKQVMSIVASGGDNDI